LRTIAHLSDMHFGRVDERVALKLAEDVEASQPDLLVISGDLTQRARRQEFEEANRFIGRFSCPLLVVPGNHDLPRLNLLTPWRRSLAKYRAHIGADLDPFYKDDEIAVAGINTSRKTTFKGGRINSEQVRRACERFQSVSENHVRIVVTHHPFEIPSGHSSRDIVGRARAAITEFAKCRIDVFMAGHLHATTFTCSSSRYKIAGYSALMVNGGTACSWRTRREMNSWNLLRVSREQISVEQRVWHDEEQRFGAGILQNYLWSANGWTPNQ
jgi:3',5'-cyclic AMP phosphodiesterase CpdA